MDDNRGSRYDGFHILEVVVMTVGPYLIKLGSRYDGRRYYGC